MPPLVLKPSRLKYFGLLILTLGFVALGAFLVRKADSRALWIGWTNIVFFGAGAVLFVRQIVDTRPRVVIDENGIFDRTLGVGVIPWAAIVDARLQSVRSIPFICLELRNPDAWRARLGPIRRALTRGNEAFGCAMLNVNLSGIQVDPLTVLVAIHEGIARTTLGESSDRSSMRLE